MSRLVVAIHDVSPSTHRACDDLRRRVAARADGPVSLLVVPRAGGRESWRRGPARGWARELAGGGDEVVLHGWSHRDPRGRDGRELCGRARPDVAALLRDGADELAATVAPASGLIAPSYAQPRGMPGIVRAAGLGWWATRTRVRWHAGRALLPSLSLGASSPARRAASPAVARAGAAAAAALPVVRLDLHPADLRHRRLAHAVDELLDVLLGQGRSLVTHAGLIARVPP